MRHGAPLHFFLVTCLLAGGTANAEMLAGSFVWNNGNRSGDLEAVFTSTGDGAWDVSFHFTWEGEPRVFAGTAEGSLVDGDLRGEVVSDRDSDRFTFAGTFHDGVFQGTHAFINKRGESRKTGRLKLETK